MNFSDTQIRVMMRESNAYLTVLLGASNVAEWWQKPNLAFEGKTPIEIWSENPKRVYQYLVTAGDGYW
jgi:hypothetical protein